MKLEKIKGKAYVLGDDINTDLIIPARYMQSYDPKELSKHALEDLDPKEYPVKFVDRDGKSEYKIIIAGKNFGCGSSREHAPVALNAAGIEAVIAKTFARIYYRNSINGGRKIYPLETEIDLSSEFSTGDEVELDAETGNLRNITKGREYVIRPISGTAKEIIEAGGLIEYNSGMME